MERWLSRKKLMIMFTVSTALLMLSVAFNVSAASNLIEINAYLNNGIKIMLHGKPFEPKDPADGTKYVPITYKGRTYLPLRAVAEEAAGLKVTWDANTNTAYIGDVSGDIVKDQITWINASPEFGGYAPRYRLKSRAPEFLTAGDGTVFNFGYFGEYQSAQSEGFRTNFEYDKFKARIWIDEEKDDEGNYVSHDPYIEFTDEHGIPIKKIVAEYGKMFEVEIAIKDVEELNIHVRGSYSIIGEPMLGK